MSGLRVRLADRGGDANVTPFDAGMGIIGRWAARSQRTSSVQILVESAKARLESPLAEYPRLGRLPRLWE